MWKQLNQHRLLVREWLASFCLCHLTDYRQYSESAAVCWAAMLCGFGIFVTYKASSRAQRV